MRFFSSHSICGQHDIWVMRQFASHSCCLTKADHITALPGGIVGSIVGKRVFIVLPSPCTSQVLRGSFPGIVVATLPPQQWSQCVLSLFPHLYLKSRGITWKRHKGSFIVFTESHYTPHFGSCLALYSIKGSLSSWAGAWSTQIRIQLSELNKFEHHRSLLPGLPPRNRLYLEYQPGWPGVTVRERKVPCSGMVRMQSWNSKVVLYNLECNYIAYNLLITQEGLKRGEPFQEKLHFVTKLPWSW